MTKTSKDLQTIADLRIAATTLMLANKAVLKALTDVEAAANNAVYEMAAAEREYPTKGAQELANKAASDRAHIAGGLDLMVLVQATSQLAKIIEN